VRLFALLFAILTVLSIPVEAQVPTETGRFSHAQLIAYARKYGTPLYVYDGDRIERNFFRFKGAFSAAYPKTRFYFAVKANTNMSIVALLKRYGAGAECISMGEMKIARKLGYPGQNILFTASSKSPEELEFAVQNRILINLDSMGDLENLVAVVEKARKKASISFRVNPDVDPKTHRNISTGHKFSKFGILLANDEFLRAYRRARECPWLDIKGIHSHIGSQIMTLEPFTRNVELVLAAARRLKTELGIELEFVDLGGGLGIPYEDGALPLAPEVVAREIGGKLKAGLADLGYTPTLVLEPGRFFVANAGYLISRVNSVKHTPLKNFINVDTGFNQLIRPLLYEAYHRVRVLNGSGKLDTFDVAGNVCESGDILAHDRLLPTPVPGDFIAILDTGAYGASMASQYNSFPLPAEILVRGERDQVIRNRATFEDLFRNQVLLDDFRR
jgi:diaminopimelate decarboxylase